VTLVGAAAGWRRHTIRRLVSDAKHVGTRFISVGKNKSFNNFVKMTEQS
jgi:hypothetical protein